MYIVRAVNIENKTNDNLRQSEKRKMQKKHKVII